VVITDILTMDMEVIGAIQAGAGVPAGAGAIQVMVGAIQVMVGAIPVMVMVMVMATEELRITAAEEVITAIIIIML